MNCSEFLDTLKDDYDLVSVLAKKNGATVLRMRNRKLIRDIIIKVYSSPVSAYDSLKNIKHDNLAETYDTLYFEDGQIVLEEYIDGVTVAEVLESGRYTYGGAKKVLMGVCSAVSFLHDLRIIHRDIKPENIIIDKSGKVKLIDLNASRKADPQKSRDTVVLGTVGYAPPEQLGIASSDERADIYALGVMLNVMLTGDHPSSRLAKGKARRIILKCTSIDPGSRFASVEKFMMAL